MYIIQNVLLDLNHDDDEELDFGMYNNENHIEGNILVRNVHKIDPDFAAGRK